MTAQADYTRQLTRIRDAQLSLPLPLTSLEQPLPPDIPNSQGVIIPPPHQTDTPLQIVIILLHDHGEDEISLREFTLRNFHQPGICCLLLRGTNSVESAGGGYHWADSSDRDNAYFLRASQFILDDLVRNVLIQRCHFHHQKIVLFGQGQGGAAVLAIAALWESINFGGVISIGGPIPDHIPPHTPPRGVGTSALIIGGKLGSITPQAEQRIKSFFKYLDVHLRPDSPGCWPLSDDELGYLEEFLGHALRREEWTKQAVMTLDGGGIRGYGSLLILKALMNKIGDEERRIDNRTESSFYPCTYKPRSVKPVEESHRPGTGLSTTLNTDDTITATSTQNLTNSARFLPCHYFTYIGGTSTGGLISIMLSRLRMAVDDCIEEYKVLGGKVFGSPRPLAYGGVLWHKFAWRRLRDAIEDVTRRHMSRGEARIGVKFPSDEDLCKTVVVAYASNGSALLPYLFRTYRTFRVKDSVPGEPRVGQKALSHICNPGDPQNLDIHVVGRATSAAPSYFPPVEIPSGESKPKTIRFKDGGFGTNNPSVQIYNDVKSKHGGYTKVMGPFLSIGTGSSEVGLFAEKKGRTELGTRIREGYAVLKAATKLPAITEGAHRSMQDFAVHDHERQFPYYRFDGGKRLGQVKMDEWKSNRLPAITGKDAIPGFRTIREIEDAVTLFLARADVDQDLNELAKLLVRRRRLRTRHESDWERYASASWYECHRPGCPDQVQHKTCNAFKDHVRSSHNHNVTPEEIDKARRCWLYPH